MKILRTKVLSLMLVLTLLFCFAGQAQATIIKIDGIDPVITIEKHGMEQAVAGSDFTITFGIRNIGNNLASNLNLSFKVKDRDDMGPFVLKTSESTTSISKIEGNETRTVVVTFSVKPDAQNMNYELIANLTGENALGQQTVNNGIIINVPVTYDLVKPVLLVNSVSISPENPDMAEEFTVNITLHNLSKTTDACNVTTLLNGNDNFEIMDISNKKVIYKIEKNNMETVSYRIRAKDSRSGNAVKLTLGFDYKGNNSEKVEESINLPLPWNEVGIGATPWVIVNKYTLSAERVLAGNTVTLRLYIENTNQRPVKNVKISLGVIKIEDSSSSAVSSGGVGGTVFSPINSSNSFYVEYIPGKTVINKDIDLYVDPNASAKTYIVPVSIIYEDRTGKTLECEELVNIPVTQECKLQVLSVEVPDFGFVGQPIPVYTEFVNVGKVVLGNFMVSLQGDFNTQNGNYYVGNLDIGLSDIFQGEVIPRAEGEIEGDLVFSYIDNNNKDVEVRHPFKIKIEAQPPMEQGAMEGGKGQIREDARNMPVKGNASSSWGSRILTLVLSFLVLAGGFLLWRKKRKKVREEFFDE